MWRSVGIGVLLASVANAQMAEQLLREVPMTIFSGGLVLDRHSALLRADECTDVRNMLFDEGLSLRTAGGTIAWGQTGLPAGVLPPVYEYVRSDGSRRLVCKAGETVYAMDGDGVWYAVVSGLARGEQMSFATHQNMLWMTNQVDGVRVWDGSTVRTISSAPRARYVVSYNGKVWLLGSYDRASFASFSVDGFDPTDERAWNDLYALDIDSDNGEQITGAGVVNGYLVVYKNRSTYVIYGHSMDTIGYVGVSKEYGCVDGGSLGQWRGFLLALDRRGITACDGTNLRVISDRVRPLVSSMRATNTLKRTWTTTRTDEFNSGAHSNTVAGSGYVCVASRTIAIQGQDFSSGTVDRTTVTADGVRLDMSAGTMVRIPLEYGVVGGAAVGAIDLYGENARMTDNDWNSYCRFRYGSVVTEGSFTIWRVPYQEQRVFYPRRISWMFGARGYIPAMRVVLHTVQYGDQQIADYPGSMWSMVTSDVREHKYWKTVDILPSIATTGVTGISFIGLNLDRRYADNTDEAHILAPRMYEVAAWEATNPVYFSSGTYTSDTFDGGGTDTEWKMLTISYTTAPGTSIRLYTRTSPNMSSWTSWELLGTDGSITNGLNRYMQYRMVFETTYSSHTPQVHGVVVYYVQPRTGTYVSGAYHASGISEWGNVYLTYGGNVDFAVRAATTKTGLASATWDTVSNGDSVPASASTPWIQWRAVLTGATAYVDAVAVTYYVGEAGNSPISAIDYDGRYVLGYSSHSSRMTSCLIFDRNGSWTIYEPGLSWDALTMYGHVPYAVSTGTLHRLFASTVAVPARWASGDFDCGYPNHSKLLKFFYVANPPQSARMTIDWHIDHSTYPVHVSTVSLASPSSRYMFPGQMIGRRVRAVVRSTSTIEIHSIAPYVEILPLR